MKKLTKAVLSLALCLSLMLGSSVSSMAASGTISYSSFRITYKTSTTSAKITVTGFPSNSYRYIVDGTVCEVKSDGTACKTQIIYGGRGFDSTSSLVASATPHKGFKFSNTHPKNNKAVLQRGRTFADKDLVDIFNFRFTI